MSVSSVRGISVFRQASALRPEKRPGDFYDTAQSPNGALVAGLDKSVLQIRDWLTVEEEMLRQQAVVVGDVDEIMQLLDKQKNVLRELEQKKPQLDELVHTAENLRADTNRQQLHGKGKAPLFLSSFRGNCEIEDEKFMAVRFCQISGRRCNLLLHTYH
ncbi:hypothetical protein KM043_004441 [Ampulex compressa]|nr:hypothetical protein KM043_004441 [Ampulex compressa]